MAIIDYGAIAFKNGKLISTDMFTPMSETCGFSDKQNYLPGINHSLDGNCFALIGNRQFVIGFYKETVSWWLDHGESWLADRYEYEVELLSWSGYHGWKKWEKDFSTVHCIREITVKPKNGYYVARIRIGTDQYKVYFGYGVDFRFYKKTGRVNYYRSPEFFIRQFLYKIKRFFKRN